MGQMLKVSLICELLCLESLTSMYLHLMAPTLTKGAILQPAFSHSALLLSNPLQYRRSTSAVA